MSPADAARDRSSTCSTWWVWRMKGVVGCVLWWWWWWAAGNLTGHMTTLLRENSCKPAHTSSCQGGR